jgi:hypothetical protein
MKKLATLLFLFVFANIAFCSTKFIDSGKGTIDYNFLNESITNGSYLEKTFSYVGNQRIDFNATSSSGTITTANVAWILNDGTVLASETLISGVPIKKPLSSFVRVRVMNTTGGTVTATGNIMLSPSLEQKKKYRAYLQLTIPASSTTVTVTQANQGFWFFKTDQKIYVDWAGGTATSADFIMNANDAIDTGVFYTSGDVIKMKADSATANVTGYSYE